MKNILLSVGLFLLTWTGYAQIITTVAGCGTCGSVGDGGMATDAELSAPIGIVFDATGNYYITDRDRRRIRKVTPAGIITTIAGTGVFGYSGDNGPASAAKLSQPYGIALDATGNIYFADLTRIRKISTSGIITTIAGTGLTSYNGDNIPATDANLSGTSGIAFDATGNIYISDGHRVRKINTLGIITTIAGVGSSGYNGDGIPATNAQLNEPGIISMDKDGILYFVDINNNRVRTIDATGIIHTFAGSGTLGYSGDNASATSAQLNKPCGVYADVYGNVYIGDTYNSVIRKVHPNGIITTIAGNGTAGFGGDGGLAIAAKLITPVGITMNTTGDIYIADAGNNRVRKIASTVFVPQTGKKEGVKIFPNPIEDCFTVNITTLIDTEVHIVVTDAAGHKVKEVQGMTNEQIVVALGDAPPGVYMLYATNADNLHSEKIVKTK